MKIYLVGAFCLFCSSLYAGDDVYVTSKNGLVMRVEPSIYVSQVCVVPFAEKIEIKKKTTLIQTIDGFPAAWIQVEYNKRSGYVWSGFVSEYKPIIDTSVVGQYKEKIESSKIDTPSTIVLHGNNKFDYRVNLCDKFGVLSGRWFVVQKNGQRLLVLQIQKSNFDIEESDCVELVYQIQGDKLKLFGKPANWDMGCDFVDGDLFQRVVR